MQLGILAQVIRGQGGRVVGTEKGWALYFAVLMSGTSDAASYPSAPTLSDQTPMDRPGSGVSEGFHRRAAFAIRRQLQPTSCLGVFVSSLFVVVIEPKMPSPSAHISFPSEASCLVTMSRNPWSYLTTMGSQQTFIRPQPHGIAPGAPRAVYRRRILD
ncbi:hypothetical protein BKA56DRAFT_573228 [Ilyonectria sp. MPI-CAGE-AT-0026]|nr:hypothetical protein BKA56DRAFT_573228 [Ilyonectria sp. MPI-CAGE-AT-0026]